ncbi:hypothetical protein E8E13_006125 [Curvularia kusanoi]|uniref:Rhodopsin domain-containing protein n=1 Tax=Curvularia kusanoi TaxID=90978 RepID=A0A9P4W3X7_CURKU|nr:hypothetical protein E8E13_006125 [Curvularia kusanoi]
MAGSDRRPELFAAALIPYTAAAIAIVLRIVARRQTRVVMLWEDYLSIVAFAIGTGFTFISLFKIRWGFGLPMKDIHLSEKEIRHHYFVDLWADMWLYTFSVGLSKFVILGFYWRMFALSKIRLPIQILFGLSAGWIVARITLICMQCTPIRKFWDTEVPGRCPLTPMYSLFGAGIPHLFIEIAILLLPFIEIWSLHLSVKRKFLVAVMFSAGITVCISALMTILHTLALDKKKNTDLTWDGLEDQIWAVCDVNLASFATSLPLLRPIFRSFGQYFSSTVKATSIPSQNLKGTGSAPTYGSTPVKRSKALDSDSEVGFVDDGGGLRTKYPISLSGLFLSFDRAIYEEIKDIFYDITNFVIQVNGNGVQLCGSLIVRSLYPREYRVLIMPSEEIDFDRFIQNFAWGAVRNYSIHIMVGPGEDTRHQMEFVRFDLEVELYRLRDYVSEVVSGVLAKAEHLRDLQVSVDIKDKHIFARDSFHNTKLLIEPLQRLRGIPRPTFVGVFEWFPFRKGGPKRVPHVIPRLPELTEGWMRCIAKEAPTKILPKSPLAKLFVDFKTLYVRLAEIGAYIAEAGPKDLLHRARIASGQENIVELRRLFARLEENWKLHLRIQESIKREVEALVQRYNQADNCPESPGLN